MARRTPGRAIWIAPNRFAVQAVRGLVLARLRCGCFSPNVLTFEQFSEGILSTSPTPVRRVSPIQKRCLLRQIVRRLAVGEELPRLRAVATTPGLVDAIAAQISELKRLEIWPDEFEEALGKRRAPPASGKDVELARIYREYQDVLARHRLYDAEGRFWSARTLLAEGHRACVAPFELVIVDGFTDLTRPQHEMLQSLAEEVDELVVSLPLDHPGQGPEPVRQDLFSKTIAMLQELKRRHGDLCVVEPAPTVDVKGTKGSASANRTGRAPPAAICDRLFRPPGANLPPLPAAAVEVWETVSRVQEVREVARDIKRRMLADGLRGEDVVVVFRSLQDAAPLVEEAFAEYGVAAHVDVRRPIRHAPFVRNLLLLLRLDQGDWKYEDVLAVIRNGSIRWPRLAALAAGEADRGVRIAAERRVRQLQIPQGRAALLGQFRRASTTSSERHKEMEIQAAAGLEALAAYFDTLPPSATAAEWAEVAQAFFPLCGPGDEAGESDPRVPIDEQARTRLVEALHGVHKLDERIAGHPRILSRAEALELLADIADREHLPQSLDTTGRVRVLAAISARGVEARHLYFSGLTEQAMPLAVAAQGYYSPRETARLIQAGLPLVSAQGRYEEEMLLFYEVVSRARDRLVLSYAALDEKALPVLASPFLEEVRRAAGEDSERLEACSPVNVVRRLDLRPVDRDAQPLCFREYRTRAVCDAVVDGGETARLQAVAAGGGPILDGLAIVSARAERETFGPAEGLFASDAAVRALAKDFGPKYEWSPTALERFALCPFRFLMERVLKIEPLDDLELATDYRRRGRLVHQCLVELYQRLERVEAQFLSASIDASRIEADMLAFLDESLARLQGGGFAHALEALDLEQVRSFSETLHLQQQCYDGWNDDLDGPPWPVHFEVRFGPPREGAQDEGEDPLSTDGPFALDLGDETIKLTGRVDRIDIGTVGGTKVFNIIDYKTGAAKSLSAKDVHQGLQLQIPLYAMAVEEHLLAHEGAMAWQADYWWLRESGFGNRGVKARTGPFALRELSDEGLVESKQWQELKGQMMQRIRQIVHSVRRGEFIVFSQDENCTRTCPYSGVCRVGQVRSLEKEWAAEEAKQA